MLCCQFIFKPGTYDGEFHRLDSAIADYASAMPGFVGSDSWVSPDGLCRNAVYYFDDSESLREFSRFQEHLTAKEQYRNWYDGYFIVVSEVKGTYGDGRLAHVLGFSQKVSHSSEIG